MGLTRTLRAFPVGADGHLDFDGPSADLGLADIACGIRLTLDQDGSDTELYVKVERHADGWRVSFHDRDTAGLLTVTIGDAGLAITDAAGNRVFACAVKPKP